MFDHYELIQYIAYPQDNVSLFGHESHDRHYIRERVNDLIDWFTTFEYFITTYRISDCVYFTSYDWFVNEDIHIELRLSKVRYMQHSLKCYLHFAKYKSTIIMLKLTKFESDRNEQN